MRNGFWLLAQGGLRDQAPIRLGSDRVARRIRTPCSRSTIARASAPGSWRGSRSTWACRRMIRSHVLRQAGINDRSTTLNPLCLLAVAGSTAAARLRPLAIVIGPDGDRFFGPDQRKVLLSERGHRFPPVITLGIARVLMSGAAYAAYAAYAAWAAGGLPPPIGQADPGSDHSRVSALRNNAATAVRARAADRAAFLIVEFRDLPRCQRQHEPDPGKLLFLAPE